MLLVGLDGVLSVPQEQTHFSMWAVLKSPLVIGAAIGGMRAESLDILRNADVISFNQDARGESARLKRRWSDAGYEVWSGPLEGDRVVAALINWSDEERELTLDLPDVGIQFAGELRNIWRGEVEKDVKTSYSASVEGHGVMLVELSETLPVGVYPSEIFATTNGFVILNSGSGGLLIGQAIDGVLPHLRRHIKPWIHPRHRLQSTINSD
jgi:alpha-galactosidase